MIDWIDDISGWNGRFPTVLVRIDLAPEQRETVLRDFVARVLDLPGHAVAISRVKDRAPVMLQPEDSGLNVSISSRGPFVAMAIARSPVGIDVEIVDPVGEIPWNVLHAKEAADLTSSGGRARIFARLWSLKEAYLKALGTGLAREPSSFAVSFVDKESAGVEDPLVSTPSIKASTRWYATGPHVAAVSIVTLRSREEALPHTV